MNNYILYLILELKGFILLSLGALSVIALFSLSCMGKKKTGIQDFRCQALFFMLNGRELCFMALGVSWICFVCSILLFAVPVGKVQLSALALLCVFRGFLSLSPAGFLGELVCVSMTGAALIVENLLRDYMAEVGTEIYIGLIWALLGLFILQYSVYHFVKGLERILVRHG